VAVQSDNRIIIEVEAFGHYGHSEHLSRIDQNCVHRAIAAVVQLTQAKIKRKMHFRRPSIQTAILTFVAPRRWEDFSAGCSSCGSNSDGARDSWI